MFRNRKASYSFPASTKAPPRLHWRPGIRAPIKLSGMELQAVCSMFRCSSSTEDPRLCTYVMDSGLLLLYSGLITAHDSGIQSSGAGLLVACNWLVLSKVRARGTL